jgi:SecD/SecF fusion protein
MTAPWHRRLRKAGTSGLFLFGALLLAGTGRPAPARAEPLVLEVTRAEATVDPRTGEPIVRIAFAEASRHLLADFTTQNVGGKTEIRVDGRVVMAPVIREPLLAASSQISGSMTPEQARDIAARLASGQARLEIELATE